MKQFVITSSMGKRLIAKGMVRHPAVEAVLKKGRLAIVAGTTNGYVAEEILGAIAQAEGFSRKGFRRGVTIAPGASVPPSPAPADVVIADGQWLKGKEVFDVVDDMQAGDVILKVDQAPIVRDQDLPRVVASHAPASRVRVTSPRSSRSSSNSRR